MSQDAKQKLRGLNIDSLAASFKAQEDVTPPIDKVVEREDARTLTPSTFIDPWISGDDEIREVNLKVADSFPLEWTCMDARISQDFKLKLRGLNLDPLATSFKVQDDLMSPIDSTIEIEDARRLTPSTSTKPWIAEHDEEGAQVANLGDQIERELQTQTPSTSRKPRITCEDREYIIHLRDQYEREMQICIQENPSESSDSSQDRSREELPEPIFVPIPVSHPTQLTDIQAAYDAAMRTLPPCRCKMFRFISSGCYVHHTEEEIRIEFSNRSALLPPTLPSNETVQVATVQSLQHHEALDIEAIKRFRTLMDQGVQMVGKYVKEKRLVLNKDTLAITDEQIRDAIRGKPSKLDDKELVKAVLIHMGKWATLSCKLKFA